MHSYLALFFAFFQFVQRINGHGRLMDPPARNSMWRFGFPNPVNYNDNELYCGGYSGNPAISKSIVFKKLVKDKYTSFF